MLKKSPLAPDAFPVLPPVPGVRVAGVSCGIRYKGRKDLFVAELAAGTALAGVFTRSSMPSAPVDWCRLHLGHGTARAIVVNSGNANAFTGAAGVDAVERTAAAAARLFGCAEREVFLASTGVIGEPLPVDCITGCLPSAVAALTPDDWPAAADAIMTTDTFPKGSSRKTSIGGTEVVIAGIAKGSGMIMPNMGTMLGFVFTDAAIPASVLQSMLKSTADRTFNAVTVDSDTSTSDTVLLCATAQARHAAVGGPGDRHLRAFRSALEEVMRDLAQQIVRDGEGAEKLVSITVTGAASAAAARRIGFAIANSPLVKTAITGEDPNWGRIVMAVGKSGERAERDRLAISIGNIPVARDGQVLPDYDEAPTAAHMKGREVEIAVDVGVGRGRATVWTCDLTHGYISINADYRS